MKRKMSENIHKRILLRVVCELLDTNSVIYSVVLQPSRVLHMTASSNNTSNEIYKALTRAVTSVIITNGEKCKAEKAECNILILK